MRVDAVDTVDVGDGVYSTDTTGVVPAAANGPGPITCGSGDSACLRVHGCLRCLQCLQRVSHLDVAGRLSGPPVH